MTFSFSDPQSTEMSPETPQIIAQGPPSHNSALPALTRVQHRIGRTREISHLGTFSRYRSHGQPIAANALQVRPLNRIQTKQI